MKSNKHRIAIYKTNKFISAQVIDDSVGKTLFSSYPSKNNKKSGKIEQAKEVAQNLSKKISDKKIINLFIDRRDNKYHGAVKEFTEELRKNGVKI